MAAPEIAISARDHPAPGPIIRLPAELRSKIFGFVYQEIVVHCSHRNEAITSSKDSKVRRARSDRRKLNVSVAASRFGDQLEYSINEVSPGLDVLLTCKLFHEEAKPIFDTAPLIVTGKLSSPFDGARFPPHIRRRINFSAPTNRSWRLALSGRPFGHDFLNRSLYPRLDCIWHGPHSRTDLKEHQLSTSPPFQELPKLLQCIAKVLNLQKATCISNELPTIYTQGFLHYIISNSCTESALELGTHDSLNTSRKQVWKMYQTIYIAGRETRLSRESSQPIILFQESFTALVVWDSGGIHLQEVPDMRRKTWWKEWIATATREGGDAPAAGRTSFSWRSAVHATPQFHGSSANPSGHSFVTSDLWIAEHWKLEDWQQGLAEVIGSHAQQPHQLMVRKSLRSITPPPPILGELEVAYFAGCRLEFEGA